MTKYEVSLRVGWIVLAIWLAASISEACDKPVRGLTMALVTELLVLGVIEMVCQAVRASQRM